MEYRESETQKDQQIAELKGKLEAMTELRNNAVEETKMNFGRYIKSQLENDLQKTLDFYKKRVEELEEKDKELKRNLRNLRKMIDI